MAKSCGTCTLCCKLFAVAELQKPAGTWCSLVINKGSARGCSIHPDRPQSCRAFECMWLQGPETTMPEDLKPSRSHVVLTTAVENGLAAHVDPNYPDAASKGAMGRFLDLCVAKGIPVVVAEGDRRRLRVRSESDLTPKMQELARKLGGLKK